MQSEDPAIAADHRRSIALARVPSQTADRCEVEIRGRLLNAAVVPKPDRERGSLVKAYVVLAPEYIARKPSGIRARARFDLKLLQKENHECHR